MPWRFPRLRYYVIMTSQRELFPRLTADMRRFKKLPQIYRDAADPAGRTPLDRADTGGACEPEPDLWEETTAAAAASASPASTPSDGNEFYPLVGSSGSGSEAQGLLYPSPLFPLLNCEVATARRHIQTSVEQAMGHCRRDNLWRRLFHGEHLALDKLKLSKLSFSELEELLNAVQSRSVGEIDPQLVNNASHAPPPRVPNYCNYSSLSSLSSTPMLQLDGGATIRMISARRPTGRGLATLTRGG